jgi:methionyl aminopeptidase
MVIRKTLDEIARMRTAGALLAELHDLLAGLVAPGMRTDELEDAAQDHIRTIGAEPSFQGPVGAGYGGFPAALCLSVGAEVVHGLPSSRRLAGGDVLTIDAGIRLDGVHSDAARTHVVGHEAAPDVDRLVRGTREALWAGIAAARVGARVGDISAAIGGAAAHHRLGVIGDHDGRVLGGHGIGRSLHEGPFIPNAGRGGRGMRLRPGLVLAIEPMCTLGAPEWFVADDGWTVVTADGALAAHWEHTVAVTEAGPQVLTARRGEQQATFGRVTTSTAASRPEAPGATTATAAPAGLRDAHGGPRAARTIA